MTKRTIPLTVTQLRMVQRGLCDTLVQIRARLKA